MTEGNMLFLSGATCALAGVCGAVAARAWFDGGRAMTYQWREYNQRQACIFLFFFVVLATVSLCLL